MCIRDRDMILRMEIPVETVKEVSEYGEAKAVERKVFPGYVLIKMVMTCLLYTSRCV